jgi:tetratricopeptide (TPR) repeat protein
VVNRAPSGASQVWLLVQLGHTLRRRGRLAEALDALELAFHFGRASGAELAAYSCAVAVHLAAGDRVTAAKVAGSARLLAAEARLLRSLGESYLDLFHEVGAPGLLDEAFACLELASLEDGVAR